MPADHVITITVDTSTGHEGDFTYSPTHVRAKPGDTIEFQCGNSNAKFEVMFKHRTPGDKTHIRHNTPKNKPSPNAPNAGHLQCGNDLGLYQYAAAISDGNNVYLDAGCGDIDVGG